MLIGVKIIIKNITIYFDTLLKCVSHLDILIYVELLKAKLILLIIINMYRDRRDKIDSKRPL